MAKFPIIRSERTVDVSSVGSARPVSDGGDIGRAWQGFGAILGAEVEKWDSLYAETKFSEAKRQASEMMGAQLETALFDADPKDHMKIFDQHFKVAKSFRPTSSAKAARGFDKLMNTNGPAWRVGTLMQSQRQITANAKIEAAKLDALKEETDRATVMQLARDNTNEKGVTDWTTVQKTMSSAQWQSENNISFVETATLLNAAQTNMREEKVSKELAVKQREDTSVAKAAQKEVDAQEMIISSEGDATLLPDLLSTLILNDPDILDKDKVTTAKSLTTWAASYSNGLASKVPDMPDMGATRVMGEAVAGLANGSISKNDYWGIYAKNVAKLTKTQRSRYLSDAEPAYSKMIGDIKARENKSVFRSVITKTEPEMDRLRSQFAGKEILKLHFDGASLKNQGESIIHSNYEQAVDDALALPENQNLSRDAAQKIFDDIKAIYESKDWVDIYNDSQSNVGFIKLESTIKKQFNASVDNVNSKAIGGTDHYSQIDPVVRARMVELMASGVSLPKIVEMAKNGEL